MPRNKPIAFVVDNMGNILEATENAINIWGELSGKNFFNEIAPMDQGVFRGFKSVLKNGKSWHGILSPISGQNVGVIISMNADGTLKLEITRETYDTKSISENEKERFLLYEDHRKRMSFISRISHDLRTPLMILRGGIELLSCEKEISKDGKDLARDLMFETDRFDRMINKVLWMTKINSGYEVDIKRHDLRKILDKFQISTNKVFPRNIKIKSNLSVFPEIMVDEFALREVLYNLLENSFKFCEDGDVWVEVGKNAEHAIISVCDEGVGIPEDDKDKIFDIEYTDKNKGGSGIGLNIVKHLTNLMGGDIRIASPKKGAEISILIPLTK